MNLEHHYFQLHVDSICLSACTVQSANIVQLKFATELALFICD
ncbi:hypothetical protein T11_6619 [Trichinella zimbabwensis]|uniref:Uncharacterized protein n=1 Tax=Trichinella zimbabwensis TaxID=268475 RepID=A0A0V1GGJ3_9BILA|nr:hypothetical protein T11_6619 [Trichinella zimbabwensis]